MKKRNIPKSLQIAKTHFPTVLIENLTPSLPEGNFPLKRLVGEPLHLEATIYQEGHGILEAVIRWRQAGHSKWQELPMHPHENFRWSGTIIPTSVGTIEYTIEAWQNSWLSWQDGLRKKLAVNNSSLSPLELHREYQEGATLLQQTLCRITKPADKSFLSAFLQEKATAWPKQQTSEEETPSFSPSSFPSLEEIKYSENLEHFHSFLEKTLNELLTHEQLNTVLSRYPDRTWATYYEPLQQLRIDRQRAGVAAWYEFFPRSAQGRADRGSTFRECLDRVEDIHQMGFDVIYFPPIHPIGLTKRKGKNNSLEARANDPGVPYAIGAAAGGHDAIDPHLGTLQDFRWLLQEIRARGMEVALDVALNCSPDHPYLQEHPEWFFQRPDGSIHYAENPPKKYEDIYPFNFYNNDWEALWEEILRVILHWAEVGVRIFRVDNPHTKPLAFWRWLLAKVQQRYPDTIFLSEAFTHPAMMYRLAKIGFTQSYSYFTWRNNRHELEQYFKELTSSPICDYFRPNLFTNTPDILPYYLQEGGRPAFLIRSILAATLSPLYGIYSGFELCENEAIPGKEEYLNSEKYQFKERDWNTPGNIKEWIQKLNTIRRQYQALQEFRNLSFLPTDNPSIIAYQKSSSDQTEHLIIIVNLDPHYKQSGFITLPEQLLAQLGHQEEYPIIDLLNQATYQWKGNKNYICLDPHDHPAHLFLLPEKK